MTETTKTSTIETIRKVYVEDFIFDTKETADQILENLKKIISAYGNATVADLYDLAGRYDYENIDTKRVWTNLENAFVVNVNGGYGLYLPNPVDMEKY